MPAVNQIISSHNLPLILVVDDDKTMRLLLRRAMEQEGYRVVEASNGEQCLAIYKSQKPDLVLLDAVMPVMDGFSCCSKLQALADKAITPTNALNEAHTQTLGCTTPVLMITSLEDPESVDRAFEVGVIPAGDM